MNFEFNPFQLDLPSSQGPIQSITIASNLDWLDFTSTPLVGTNVNFPIDAKTDIAALKVFATGVGVGKPSMISLSAGHIPNIEISQVNGLQATLNTQINTLAPGSAYITVDNNGAGDYLITANVGNTANTLAAGDDIRFPANVGTLGLPKIRLSFGQGSTDVAATAKVDYWDTSVAVASGASHSKGLVPDPGATPGTTKFLNEDMTFKVPAGSGTVTSVGLVAPSIFSVTVSPITTSGNLTFTLATTTTNKFFIGPASGGAAAPTFRAIDYLDVTSIVGSASSTIASGNDTRFPSSVIGLRKSAGAGSTDVAATPKVDYWNTDTFGAAGPSHSKGLVPDPGVGAGSPTRHLREDGTWTVFTPAAGTITNSMLADMPANTIKANNTGGAGTPLDLDAKSARGSALFNIESITTHGDSDYTMLPTDKYVATSAALTAIRTWSLPLANTFNPAQTITVADDFGGINGANVLKVARQGSDLIQGSSAALTLNVTRSSVTFASDGISKWSVTRRSPSIIRTFFTSNATYTTPTGAKALFVEVIGGGGGGGGAVASASNASAGGGGGAGGYASVFVSSPVATYAMVVGAAGAGGVGAASGSTGGTTSLGGSVAIAQGGNGGSFIATGTTQAFIAGGSGGVSTSGDMQLTGDCGQNGLRLTGTIAKSGDGSSTIYGGKVNGLFVSEANGNTPGVGYGNGGGGALSYSTNAKTGGDGRQGVIVITEYY